MRNILRCFATVFTLLPAVSFAVPDDSQFKKVKKGRDLVIKNCAAVTGLTATTLRITEVGKFVELPSRLNRNRYRITGAQKFFACGVDETTGSPALFSRATRTGTINQQALTTANFPEREDNLGSACSKIQSWPGSFIYKTVGSTHFSSGDPRRYSMGLILKYGASVSVSSCIDIFANNGDEVGQMGLYARGAGWYARYYGGTGCGTSISGASLASRARQASGSSDIYVRFGSTCYGPINAGSCVGSSQC